MILLLQRILVVSLILICCSIVANAVTIQAKVIEVPSGNILVVANANRTIRLRLKAIVPPEAGQPFNETARDHLKMLLIEKVVMVEYTHFAGGLLDAKVLLDGADVGAQMLRDGVAWYDHATDYELSASDRDMYAQCELAARSEKRGLWQDKSPVAPWEYRRLQKAKLDQIVDGPTSLRTPATLRSEKKSLSNDFSGALMPGSVSYTLIPGLRPIVQNGSFDHWTSFESPSSQFSIMIPSSGLEGSTVVTSQSGQPVAVDIVIAGNPQAFLVLFSGTGPNENYTDSTAMDKSIGDLIKGMNEGASQHGHDSSQLISLKPVRDLKLAGYAGRQYSLTSEYFSGSARVFTKQMGDQRRVVVMYALNRPGAEDIASQFLNSLKFSQ